MDAGPLRGDELLFCGLCPLHGCRSEFMLMLVAICRRRAFIMMMLALRRLAGMRSQRYAPMLQDDMRAGKKPGEQHENSNGAAKHVQTRDVSAAPVPAVKRFLYARVIIRHSASRGTGRGNAITAQAIAKRRGFAPPTRKTPK